MRTAFIETLSEMAAADDRVWLLTGDLGFSVFEDFKAKFPSRFVNVGVAEQNLMGMAAGLALLGKRPYVYSITTFASMRAYEQVRNDICYQGLPVVIIGGGSLFSYSTFGATHLPFEDFALMRVLPGMAVLSPGDPHEVQELLRATLTCTGPAYMRIAKKGEPLMHEKSDQLEIGTVSRMRDGNDVTICVTGRQLPNALDAATQLADIGVHARVLSVHTLKPLDRHEIRSAAQGTRGIVTVEEHSRIGGLTDAVTQVLQEERLIIPLVSLSLPDEFPKGVYSQDAFLAQYHLTSQGIQDAVSKVLQ